ncbi:MAG: DUF2076 family protein [Steroidobacteraceae bacterium]
MNAQERAALAKFLDQLVEIHEVDKIAEADLMIRRALERQPDAAYLLVQRALLLSQALAAAKARIADLERGQAGSNQGFLSSGTSHWSAANQAPSAASVAPVPPTQGPSSVAAPSGYAPPPVFPAPAPQAPSPGAGPSFLGQVAATAAGVAGGAFLFEGIEGLLGRHGTAIPAQAGTAVPEDVTINNYYPSDAPGFGDPSGEADDFRPDSDDYGSSEDSDEFV